MLDQMVESRNTGAENKFKNGLLLGTLILVFGSFVTALGVSLFNEDLFVGGDGLELSTLVAPPIPEEAPPPPEEKKPDEKEPQKKINADVRKVLIANIDTTPPKTPPKPSTTKMKNRAMSLDRPTIQGNRDADTFDNTKERPKVDDLNKSKGFETGDNQKGKSDGGGDNKPKPPPPPPPPKPKPTPKPKPPVPKRISGGVVNGKATSLPKPAYPAAARSANIKGSVNVAIVISKTGRVMSARAVSGHPLLKRAAVSAARRAKFRPTKLSGQAVEVSGVIVYNFQ